MDWTKKFQFLIGGYGSSKSYHVALKLVLKCLQEKRKVLVIREVYDTHKDSTFALFKDILESLDRLDDTGRKRIAKGKARAKESPYEIVFSNGSRIIFKGMDKPAKLKSIHDISIIWVEEASEVKYEGFKELVGRLRHRNLSLHMILSSNPVDETNWIYTHFFVDEENEKTTLNDEELYKLREIKTETTYYHHSKADDNMFLPQSYIDELDDMKNYDPDLHRVAREGKFGANGEKILPQLEVWDSADVQAQLTSDKVYKNGMDFGFSDSYNAIVRMAVDIEEKWLYIFWEYYTKGKTDPEIAEDMMKAGLQKVMIKGDNAEAKTIVYLQQRGFRILPCYKLTRVENTKKMKRFKKIIVSKDCPNTIRELKNLTQKKDKNGKAIPGEFNIDPHTFSAMWYGLDDYEVTNVKGMNAGYRGR
ncbi:PBSX family phage terminase large subunit [Lysinibacillus sp. OL1]|uniref:PBSX family phage terminase large subunit n=2 Tax=Lysinibacillus TaxID=400634 RepID=UPI001D11385E|nr:PBSX family phage terminase large subunit [Lysinibacillus sp. OL1]